MATVDENGVVTAKRKGITRITARTEYDTGQLDWISCFVTVRANEYKQKQTFVVPKSLRKCKIQVYHAYYDTQGNLRIKCTLVNGSKKSVKILQNLKIVLRDESGKTIGTYTIKKKSVSAPFGCCREFEVKIKASEVKIKDADLTKAKCSASAKYK